MAQSQSGFLQAQGAPLYYEVAGQGHPLLLIHAGIADSRMWDQQFDTFARQYRVIRFDLRGFGQSTVPAGAFANHEDPAALLAFLGIEKAHVVALSFGGKVALDFVLTYPEKVTSLVLVAPSVGGEEPSAEIEQFAREEEALLEQGDLVAAAELNVRTWVVGPGRTTDQVDPAVRQRVYDMQYHAFTVPIPDTTEVISPEPQAITRLADIRVPALLMIGDYDLPTKQRQVERLAAEIPQAQSVVIPGAAHMVNMEQPEEFNRVVLDFLAHAS
ncbi:MAG: alpha/beta hydrolase [Chloroflexi bacterium]|nr:MAG: alpha/beta hydrolase [Chloroflexota bacterium]